MGDSRVGLGHEIKTGSSGEEVDDFGHEKTVRGRGCSSFVYARWGRLTHI
jgi:hypothetical protein